MCPFLNRVGGAVDWELGTEGGLVGEKLGGEEGGEIAARM